MLSLAVPALPQLNLGQISGVVTDPSGASVPGAAVTVRDVNRGVARNLTTDNAGQYSAPSLTPGAYSVRVSASGFTPVERRDVTVGVGPQVRIDIALETGAQNQTVEVTGAPPIMNTSNASISTTLEPT